MDLRKIFFIFTILFLCSISLADARIFSEGGDYYVEQDLKVGWNLISGISFSDPLHSSSVVVLDEILSSYYFKAEIQEDVQIRPVYEAGTVDALVLYANAFWVNSLKADKIIYKASSSFVNKSKLGGYYSFYAGNNTLAINNDMYNKTINELKADCDAVHARSWNASSQSWINIGLDQRLNFESQDTLTGRGLSIGVTSDCKFMNLTVISSGEEGVDGSEDDNEDDNEGSGSSSTTLFNLATSNFQAGYTRYLTVGSGIRFKVGDAYHSVVLDKILGTSARINVSSTVQQATLLEGDIQKFEVSDDDFYDLTVEILNVSRSRVRLTIKSLNERIPGTEPDPIVDEDDEVEEVEEPEPTLDPEEKSNLWIWIILIIIAIIIVAGAIFFVIKSDNKGSNLGQVPTAIHTRPPRPPMPPRQPRLPSRPIPRAPQNLPQRTSFNNPGNPI
jgi:hypothetical protein